MALPKKISWSKAKGYECSSKGDSRFSALFATLEDGRTIEQHYQCDVKGYDIGGTNWKLGKGKPPLDTKKKLFPEYINLWKRWANIGDNYKLLSELRELAVENDYYLRDSFANTPINQAHALSNIINDLDKVSKAKVSVDVYTDGSARPNPGSTGYGFSGIDSNGVKYLGWGPVSKNSTNNVAELLAVAFAIQQITKSVQNLSKIRIFADSQYVLKHIKFVDQWRHNGWIKSDGAPVANKDVWVFLDGVISDAETAGISLSFEWVRGHNGTLGNELADERANLGRMIAIDNNLELSFELNDFHKFETSKTIVVKDVPVVVDPLNKLFYAKRWFFYTNVPEEINGTPFYFGSCYEDKKDQNNKNLGKRAPDTMYTLLLTKSRIDILDRIRNAFNNKFGDSTLPIVCNLTKISSLKTWQSLVTNFDKVVKFEGNMAITEDGETLGELHLPPKLACKVPNIITTGYNFIKWYLSKVDNIFIYDITDHIYSTVKSKQVCNANFTVSTRFLDILITIPYFDSDGTLITPKEQDIIRLTTTVDLPPRNTFSALLKSTKDVVKVSLLVMDSVERSCRVAVILECGDDICVYYSVDSNFRIKR